MLGAYLVLFPRARITSLVFLGFFYQLIEVPAIVVLGFWFVLQLIDGLASLGVAGAEAASRSSPTSAASSPASWSARLLRHARVGPPAAARPVRRDAWDNPAMAGRALVEMVVESVRVHMLPAATW